MVKKAVRAPAKKAEAARESQGEAGDTRRRRERREQKSTLFGQLLKGLRTRTIPGAGAGHEFTINQLAIEVGKRKEKGEAGVSTGYLSALENGRATNPSEDLVRRLADALELPEPVRRWLYDALNPEMPLIVPGLDLDLDRTLESQMVDKIEEVWVVIRLTLEGDDRKWAERVARNIANGKKYVYFLEESYERPRPTERWNKHIKTKLGTALEKLLGLGESEANKILRNNVTCVSVASEFNPLLFRPPKVIYVGTGGSLIGGTFTKLDKEGKPLMAYGMEEASAVAIHGVVNSIKSKLLEQKSVDCKDNVEFSYKRIYPDE